MMRMLRALTRAVPVSIDRCELTHLAREPIDHARAAREHAAYEDALRALGCRIERLPDLPDHPDSVFVEDTAIVVDGGDVLVTSGTVFVGISGRTNADGARQLATMLAPHGFQVVPVPVTGCLHLKSAVTALRLRRAARFGGQAALLINPAWVDPSHFPGFELVDVDPSEPEAANVLIVGDHVICAEAHAGTRGRLEAHGVATVAVPAAELAKAEGGVTCCSIVFATGS